MLRFAENAVEVSSVKSVLELVLGQSEMRCVRSLQVVDELAKLANAAIRFKGGTTMHQDLCYYIIVYEQRRRLIGHQLCHEGALGPNELVLRAPCLQAFSPRLVSYALCADTKAHKQAINY